MTGLSAETRRFLELARAGDDLPPSRESVVRERLIARLGATAVVGVAATSIAAGSAQAAGASIGATGAATTGATMAPAAVHAATTGPMTAALVKTVATFALVGGLGAGAIGKDALMSQPVRTWPHEAGARVGIERAWSLLAHDARRDDTEIIADRGRELARPSFRSEPSHHERLVAIARRPDRPVAKEAELVLVLGAEDALSVRDYAGASRSLDLHEAEFATGALADHREALRILLDCGAGAIDKARARAARFARTFPVSDQIGRVAASACAASGDKSSSAAPRGGGGLNF